MVRPHLPIRLLALDIDGTLVTDDLAMGRRTIEAVAAARARGVAVSIVTGRMATSGLRFARQLDLREPVVGLQGAVIRSMPGQGQPGVGRLLYHRPLLASVARDACAWALDHGLDPHVNHLERLVLRSDDPKADDYSRFLGGRLQLVPDVVEWIRRPVTKIISVADDPAPLDAFGPARAAFEDRATVTISHPRFLEFVAPGVSKGRAVRWLARRLGIPLANAMAVGDQYNDLEMIAEVGHGVAMPTAPAEVLSVARHIAPPVEEEGVAQVIEEFILGGVRADGHLLPRPPRWDDPASGASLARATEKESTRR